MPKKKSNSLLRMIKRTVSGETSSSGTSASKADLSRSWSVIDEVNVMNYDILGKSLNYAAKK